MSNFDLCWAQAKRDRLEKRAHIKCNALFSYGQPRPWWFHAFIGDVGFRVRVRGWMRFPT